LSGEPAVSIVTSCGSIVAPRKDDGTDFGCIWIQSNGLIAYCCFPKITKEHTVLFLIGTLNDGDAV
jgi:hypothetical protein